MSPYKKILPSFLILLLANNVQASNSTSSPLNLEKKARSNQVIQNENANVYTEDKSNIVVSPHQAEFTIKLKSNPAAGYAWFLREYDSALITPVKHRVEQGEKNLIGTPVFEWWTFRVKSTGFLVPQQTSIRLIYTRPSQSLDSATQVVFHITTQEKAELPLKK